MYLVEMGEIRFSLFVIYIIYLGETIWINQIFLYIYLLYVPITKNNSFKFLL